MTHYMLDIETMSVQSNGAIVSIGVTEFDETSLGRNFYTNVSLESCIDVGLVIDESTVQWWNAQDDKAREAWKQRPQSLLASLKLFNQFISTGPMGSKYARIWGNGSDFDNVLLGNAFKALDADIPWKFYNNRCYRTVVANFPLEPEEMPARVGTYHNALDDAITQALRLQAICNKYSIKLQ